MSHSEEYKAGAKVASELLMEGLQEQASKAEVEGYITQLAVISIKILAGMKGQEFKRDFLGAAIDDEEAIAVMSVN